MWNPNYKLMGDNTGENPQDLRYSDVFLDTTAKTQSGKKITDKLCFIKTKTFAL